MRPKSFILMALVGAALGAGCATPSDIKASVCDGKHRRPANPYGSALAVDTESNAPSSTLSAPATIGRFTRAPEPHAAIDPRSLKPCGARA